MKNLRILLAFLIAIGTTPFITASPTVAQVAVVVSACGLSSWNIGQLYPLQILANGNLCGAGGGGGGGNVVITGPLGTQTLAASVATTIGDGNDVTLGSKGDTTCATAAGSCTLVQLIKYFNTALTADPCGGSKTPAHFSSTSSGGNFITGTAAKITYICSLSIKTSAIANVSLCEATGTACTGGTPAAVYGNTGTTAANGSPYGANGGEAPGNGGYTIAKTATTGQNVDVLFTTTNSPLVVVDAMYVQQ